MWQARATRRRSPTSSPRAGCASPRPTPFAERYIIPGARTLSAAIPTIEIELVEAAAAANLVEQGLDLAIRIVEKPEPNLVVRRIATSRTVIVASPIYIAAMGSPRKPSDILKHHLIGFTPIAWRDTWRIGKGDDCRAAARAHRQHRIGARRRLAGLGLAAAPEWLVADAMVAGQLTRVLGEHATPSSGIYAVYPTNRLLDLARPPVRRPSRTRAEAARPTALRRAGTSARACCGAGAGPARRDRANAAAAS
jgi:DNA-binding transcriptional LysR family regulator